ncbi:ubiquitin carboxyl-terminal hydrolase 30 [Marchantia polymorpha subsp. ruderalis]|uniref:Ubiquitin carboxyl-terminal hydrolase n=1 Tax=Marchantia polymorpha TaxID=3197 RepID=A0A2R6XMT7_MARPO|nr:hypothetical protein MARPO_0008s0182 [Marchantia polymorpha]BBN19402.1 hypothetical protein Mp_8g10400 [Marchantia polymorpha subsp. ruderalis]|eukprot:PTQ47430.1 hypothetical protein MARPO_0008s0182 [Marchantia polymorpha]
MRRGVSLRGVSGSSILMSPRWRVLGPEGNAGLRTAISFIGAGTLGAILIFKCAPKLILGRSLNSVSKIGATSSSPVEKMWTVPGLQNTGNNCFLNVILQALASSQALLNFMDRCAELITEAETKCQMTGSVDKVSMPLAVAVASLMKDLSQLGNVQRTSSPCPVMRALSLYVQHFDLASQQDAAEALIHLASALQEERGNYLKWLRPTLQSFVKAPGFSEACDSTHGRLECNSVKGSDQLLDSWRGRSWPLEGTIASSLTCQRCGYQFSTQFQSFNDITVTPSYDREGNMSRGCTLESCLDHFTRPEWVDSVKCSNCSHKSALLSIFLKSGEPMMTAAAASHTSNRKVSRSKVTYIEECGCDEDCNCELLTAEEGGVWRNVYTNASKQLKIGRCPEVLCFQIQRVVIGNDGTMKKLTGHVNFPRILDMFPYTVAAKESVPLSRGDHEESMQSRSSQSSVANHFAFVNKTLPHSEISCKGGADLGHPTAETCETLNSDGKEGAGEERSATRIVSEARTGNTETEFSPASGLLLGSVHTLNPSEKEEKLSGTLASEPVDVIGVRSRTDEESNLPCVNIDPACQELPEEGVFPVYSPAVELVTEIQPARYEESSTQPMSDIYVKKNSSSDLLLRNEEVSNHDSEIVDEVKSFDRFSTTNGGISLSTLNLNVAESVYSHYTPRVLPSILQQLSSFTIPYEGQQLSAGIHPYSKKLPGLPSMSKGSSRLTPRGYKYARKLPYELVSVVVHQGGPQNGHYIVYRKARLTGTKEKSLTKESVSLKHPTADGGGDTRESIVSGNKSVSEPQLAVKEPAAEGARLQSIYGQLIELESLPDITSSKRFEPSKSSVQISNDCGLSKDDLLHCVSTPDYSQVQPKRAAVSEDSTRCIGKSGRRDDGSVLWFRVSDTNVQRVHEQEVFGAHASLLFYEQL